MTKNEWIARCAARYRELAGLTPEQATEAAAVCFDAESGEPGFEFSEAVEYRPEDCAEHLSCAALRRTAEQNDTADSAGSARAICYAATPGG